MAILFQCWQCGRPTERVQRRNVMAGRGAGFIGNPLRAGNWIFGGTYQRVDLCPQCARQLDNNRKTRSIAIFWIIMSGIVLLVIGVLAVVLAHALTRSLANDTWHQPPIEPKPPERRTISERWHPPTD